MMIKTPSISTFLWFERDAEAAAELYTSLIPDSRITKVARWGDGGPVPKGSVMTVAFELAGHPLTAINGGPHYKLTPAVSLVVSCETQEEIDHYWDALLADGGKPSMCGWLTDRFGLSWQVIPAATRQTPDRCRPGEGGARWPGADDDAETRPGSTASRASGRTGYRLRSDAMKYMLMMNAPGKTPYQIFSWPKQDIEAHIAFMRDVCEEACGEGELVSAEGLAGPDQARLVRGGRERRAGHRWSLSRDQGVSRRLLDDRCRFDGARLRDSGGSVDGARSRRSPASPADRSAAGDERSADGLVTHAELMNAEF